MTRHTEAAYLRTNRVHPPVSVKTMISPVFGNCVWIDEKSNSIVGERATGIPTHHAHRAPRVWIDLFSHASIYLSSPCRGHWIGDL